MLLPSLPANWHAHATEGRHVIALGGGESQPGPSEHVAMLLG
jgi:hypothetical protein